MLPWSPSLAAAAAGSTVKVFGWYDNESGYTHRLVDLTTAFAAATPAPRR